MYNASMCLGVWVSFHNHDSAHATWYLDFNILTAVCVKLVLTSMGN